MCPDNRIDEEKTAGTWAMLSGAGYSDKAIRYYLSQPSMGRMDHPDRAVEVTGQCGDTMKVHLKLDGDRILDTKFQVLGCPGAVASAMAAADLIKGRTLQEALAINDREVFRALEGIPDQKIDCIRLAVKTVQRAVQECVPVPEARQPPEESNHAAP